MRVLRQRLLFGPILIAALVGLVVLDQWIERQTGIAATAIFPAMLAIAILAGIELVGIFARRGIATSRVVTCSAITLGLAVASFTRREHADLPAVALVCTAAAFVMLMSMIYYSRNHTAEGVVAASAVPLLAFVYVGLMGGFIVVLRKEHDGWLVLGVLLVTKAYDIGAYFTGRLIGRHKMIPWLSPGKTWEGLAGGLALSTLAGVGAVALARETGVAQTVAALSVPQAAGIGFLLGLVGQGGDLLASLLKRDAGVKDYSDRLPGFGGVLDVIDSPLLVAPVAYWVIALITSIHQTSGG